MSSFRLITAIGVLVAPLASAEPARPQADASAELRVHVGDTAQDEVPHYGLFPSIVLGGGVTVRGDVAIAVAVAAAKISAIWENIGGVANGLVEGKKRIRRASWLATIGIGVAFPLDDSIPGAECFMPEKSGGDSLVLDFGTNTACWDRSAYRRAAIHRGAWNLWLWAPDWVTAVGTGRFEATSHGLRYAIEAGVGAAFAVTDAHEGESFALIGQLAGEADFAVSRRWSIGARMIAAGVALDEQSPFLISGEPYAEVAPSRSFRLRLSLLVPFVDLSNDDVPPGRGGYQPRENVSIGFTANAAF